MVPFLFLAFLLGAIAVGCGESASQSSGGAGGATAGKGPVAGGADGKGGSGGDQASGGDEANAAATGGGGDGGTGADPVEDDCRLTDCEAGLTCVPSDGVCSSAGPTSCVDLSAVTCVERPVCGCDGEIYASNCAALMAGAFIAPVALCAAPSGVIECINAYCDAASEYCDMRRHYGPSPLPLPCDQGPPFSWGVCHPLPGGCGADPTCACVADEPFDDCPTSPSCSDVGDAISRSCLSGCYG